VSDDRVMAASESGSGADTGEQHAAGAVAAPPAPPVPPAPPGTAGWTPPAGGPGRDRGWRTGGAAFGVLLVVAGLIALFGGFTSVFDLLRLWPLFIVFGGLMHVFSRHGDVPVKRVAEGLGTVALGLLLLGNTFGYVQWSVWFTLISLWPLLLVAIGIELVGRGLHMDWLRALSSVVLILGLAYGVFVLQPVSGRAVFPIVGISQSGAAFSDVRPHDPAVLSGTVDIKVGATRLTLSAGNALAGISGTAPSADAPQLSAPVAGATDAVTVTDPSTGGIFVGAQDRSLDVTLDGSVKWSEIRFDVGAVTADADLSRLEVARVVMNVGASDARLKIGALAKSVSVDVSGGATSVTILVPVDAACTVDAKSGLSDVRVPASFRQTSGIAGIGESSFVADGAGGPTIAISLSSGVSDLRVETY
jgi:hypothetical protein